MVLDDASQALRAAAEGECVVLIVAADGPPFSLPESTTGRVGVFVGPAGQTATLSTAEEMAAELFR